MESIPQLPPGTTFVIADDPALPPAVSERPAKKYRNAGRKRDPVWDFTTVFPDKRVVCNRCHALIHRYGVAKVERVRNHFERKCTGTQEQVKTLRDREETAAVREVTLSSKQPKVTLSGSSYGNKSGAFKRKFAYWLYATGQCFDDMENQLLLSALRVLRTDVTLPTKHELENELLDLEFTASKTKVTKALSGKKCCLTIEHRVDAGGASVTTYGAICEAASYYLESKTDDSQESRGELTAGEVEAVMAKEKKAEFYGIVTPAITTLSACTRERVQKKYPRCTFFHGCVSSALTLLLSDIKSVLPWLKTVQTAVAELAQVFHGNQKLQMLVSCSENSQTMEFPDSSSMCALLEALLKHEKVLYAIVARRDFADTSVSGEQEKCKRVQDFVLSETFVQDLMNSLAVLRPLQEQLRHFINDLPPLSQVFPCFVELLTVYSAIAWVSKKEKALITSCVTERFNAIYGDSHGVAYMLDPLYLGQFLDEQKKRNVESFIVRFCENEGHAVDILTQLAKYKAMVCELKENNQAYWQLLQSGALSPHDFWMERRVQFPYLHQLAVAVFALPASTTSRSSSFGEKGFMVHSRYHRKLSPDQLQKLAHVYCNSERGESEPLTMGA
uniref:BED-type domain-containing protein n=1 Tax=Peronospora matthiolae TaxID=2874970 RepID=A0AAV1VLK1_9STRA